MREDLITAYLDGELDESTQIRVERELDANPELRRLHDELLSTRAGLRRHFAHENVPAAPKIPAARPRAFRITAILTAATVLIATVAVVMIGERRAEASAETVMERAVRAYAEADEAELWVRWELPGGAALEKLLAKGKSGFPTERALKVRVGQGNRFLAMPTNDPAESWRARRGLMGFDGERFWRLVEEDGESFVRVRGLDQIREEPRRRFNEHELVRMLSWDFVRDLAPERVLIKEVTWPADRQSDRRVFEARPREEKAGSEGLQWRRARVTVDPKSDRIERLEAELVVYGFAAVRVTVDVAEVDGARDDGLYRAESHVPADIPRRASAGN